jgi:uncharacterized protein (DUF433 family)
MSHTTRWIKVISVALLVVLGLSVIGGATVTQAQGGGQGGAPGGRGGGQVGQLGTVMFVLLSETSKATKLSVVDILAELRTGKSLSEIIKANGGDVAAVKAAAKTSITDQVKAAVTNKRLTQQQADAALANLDQVLDRTLEFKVPTRSDVQDRVQRVAGVAILMRETAKQANITQRDLLTELRAGKTLAQIATEHKADPAKIVTAAVATTTTLINQRVTAGRMTKEEGDKLIAGLQKQYTDTMNAANPLGVGIRGGRPGRPGRPGQPGNQAPTAAPTAAATPAQ